MPAAIALFVGSPSSLEAADFAFFLATCLLRVQTAQPRTAFRLFSTLMARAYPSRQSATQKQDAAPPSGVLWREGLIRAREEELDPDRPRTE